MKFVKYEEKGNYAILTIDRPEALNALNSQVIYEIGEAVDAINLETIRCMIITGAGKKSFVAGADIAEMSHLTQRGGERFGREGSEVFRRIARLPIPVIAAVNGFALGGGCELALACDIRIASDNARFGQPEVTLGITPGFGGTQRLARIIGTGKAKEMLFTGSTIDAKEAYRLMLVNEVYPADELMAAAEKLAQNIAHNAPIAVQNTKCAINEGKQVDIDSALTIEAHYFGDCFETSDQIEGMAAFIEHRKHEAYENK
ncbi:MAG: enoyl-CoA hydratase-related protein [Pygmaiobacter sp.]